MRAATCWIIWKSRCSFVMEDVYMHLYYSRPKPGQSWAPTYVTNGMHLLSEKTFLPTRSVLTKKSFISKTKKLWWHRPHQRYFSVFSRHLTIKWHSKKTVSAASGRRSIECFRIILSGSFLDASATGLSSLRFSCYTPVITSLWPWTICGEPLYRKLFSEFFIDELKNKEVELLL